jgi:rhodanese-related sulfurtransferase
MFNFFKSNQLNQDKAYAQLQEDKTILLVDVRTKEEFRDGHIKNAVNIPLNTLAQRVSGMLPHKDQRIFVVCLSGARAAEATDYLKKSGYLKVENIGGVGSWKYGLVK